MKRAAGVAALLLVAGPAGGQDFAPVRLPGPDPGGFAMLEHGLPAPGGAALESALTRWFALPSLTTRACALALPVVAARIAAGLSQTGEPDVGWTTAALAVGAASPRGGGAVRGAWRRDRDPAAPDAGLGPGRGAEVGAGMWLAPHPQVRAWASAPHLHTAGVEPPLARPLTCGAAVTAGELVLWATLRAPRAHAESGERRIGVAMAVGTGTLWLEGREGPWRAAGGLEVRAGGWRIAGAVEAHPVLGETTRIGIGRVVGAAR